MQNSLRISAALVAGLLIVAAIYSRFQSRPNHPVQALPIVEVDEPTKHDSEPAHVQTQDNRRVAAMKAFVGQRILKEPDAALKAGLPVKGEGVVTKKLAGKYKATLEAAKDKQKFEFDLEIQSANTKGSEFAVVKGTVNADKKRSFYNISPVIKLAAQKEQSTIFFLTGKAFVHLFYVPKDDAWIGNYYQATGESKKFQYAGKYLLARGASL